MEHMVTTVRELLAEGSYYEAQQMYQNAASRFAAHQQHGEARELLSEGVLAFAQADKSDMAAQLGCQYVRVCEGEAGAAAEGGDGEAAGTVVTGFVQAVAAMCDQAFPPGAGEGVEKDGVGATVHEARVSVLLAAIKWATPLMVPGDGALAVLHLAAARSFRGRGDFASAGAHYVRAREPAEFAGLVTEVARAGEDGEQELFICRAVLQYLALGNAVDAQSVLECFDVEAAGEGGGGGGSLEPSVLLNFSRLLVSAVSGGSNNYELFAMLWDKYSIALGRDPCATVATAPRPAPRLLSALRPSSPRNLCCVGRC
jgi:hypothetical protein